MDFGTGPCFCCQAAQACRSQCPLQLLARVSALLRALGVRYVLTDADALDKPAILRGSVSAPDVTTVRLFELINPNLGTYSPTRFVKAVTADAIAQRIEENKNRL